MPPHPDPRGGREKKTRALGQHFLADPAIADRIVEATGATAADVVCEIGPGCGALTARLAARARRLVGLEIDPRLCERLAVDLASRPNVEIRCADARTFAYEALPADDRLLVVGNLPYSASKPILQRIWDARARIAHATVMVQREVAERLVARPRGRDYGALSVLWQMWTDLELLFVVPPEAFVPRPAVDSAVVRAVFRPAPRVAVADPAAFVRVVRAGFAHRRKTLANALRAAWPGADPAARLAEAGIDGTRRAETLSLAEFARLAEVFARSGAA